MNCPACGNTLSQKETGGITVDVCAQGCGGIWFDQLELIKVDEPHEAAGEELLNIKADPNVKVDFEARRKCPKCPDMIMMRHFFSVKRKVEVDECPKCAGFWLDAGELKEIRDSFPSEEARKEAATKVLNETFGDKLSEMKAKSEEGSARVKRIARVFRFLCPSYYIPGKQEWGAF